MRLPLEPGARCISPATPSSTCDDNVGGKQQRDSQDRPTFTHAKQRILLHMGFQYRKRKKLSKDSWLNYSGSGVSASKRFGPVTVNSRGGVWVKLPGGLTYRGKWK